MILRLFRVPLCTLALISVMFSKDIAAAQNQQQAAQSTSDLRVALQTFNPILATRRPDGQYRGVGVDLAAALGESLGRPVKFVFYPDAVHFNQSIGKDEWDVAIAPRDLSRTGQLAFTEPLMEIDTSYVARPGLQFRTPEEIDSTALRVGVAQASAAYGFLSRTLKRAQIVRLYGGVADARQALSAGRVDVYADYTHVAYRIALEVPGSTVLVSPFNVMRMTIVLPKANAEALPRLNEFIKEAKRDGVIAGAINRAGLRGVRAAR